MDNDSALRSYLEALQQCAREIPRELGASARHGVASNYR
ncbi:conserved protein of unknown function [Pseudomonas marincola]|uniref:Uncharacterized protein n=1 Tax=Pseudomonas marincola TaxID=437900 RepID=A0A653E7K1_9PSED|nr:conserved protein of unknown function [Pseudomonas marincola]